MTNAQQMKLCKHCKTEIPKSAKLCPNCKRKQGGITKWVVIAIVVLLIIGAAAGGDSSDNTANNQTNSTHNQNQTVQENHTNNVAEEKEEEIQYTAYTVNEMMDDLNANALNASDKYKDQYIEITGRLGNIDSSGKYITLYPDDEWAITGVHCNLKRNNEEQRQAVTSMTMDSQITLRGKCTGVGEVLGYTLEIDSID